MPKKNKFILINCFNPKIKFLGISFLIFLFSAGMGFAGFSSIQANTPHEGHHATEGNQHNFPPALDSYHDEHIESIGAKLSERIHSFPLNLVVSVIFLLAIIHTFLASKFRTIAHNLEHKHEEKIKQKQRLKEKFADDREAEDEVSFWSEIFHFLGEVEVVFGIWTVVLFIAVSILADYHTILNYVSHDVNFTEPMFVVVIMTLASSRPILLLAEKSLRFFARLGGGSPAAWWFSILLIAPLLGSFITEPAAMTIAALLLSKQFYSKKVRSKLAYATIGLLFVNISVGGTLTNFAAPPVLMVAGKWGWSTSFMLTHFGWKAAIGILISTLLYLVAFRKDFVRMNSQEVQDDSGDQVTWRDRKDPVPPWITLVHIFFLGWTVLNAHYPPMFIGGFLFFLGFAQATKHHQNPINLKPSLLVGFFLAGLVIHGGLQAWWIQPVLASLGKIPLMLGATILTAFNDNAAITYLSSLVPGFSPMLKYAVVAGAVTGGGLTVIANAPNPAGQSILNKYFENGVSPLNLALAAIVPTIIMGLCFMLF